MTLEELAYKAQSEGLNTVVQFEDNEWSVYLVKPSSMIAASEMAVSSHEVAGTGTTLSEALRNLQENYP